MSHRPRTAEAIWASADLPARRFAGMGLNPGAPTDVLLRLLADGPAAAPTDVLLRLLADSPAAARMVLCRDRDLPAEVVDAVLTHPDHRARSFLAANPHADPAQRAAGGRPALAGPCLARQRTGLLASPATRTRTCARRSRAGRN